MTYRTAQTCVMQYLQRRAILGATPASPALWALSARVVAARAIC